MLHFKGSSSYDQKMTNSQFVSNFEDEITDSANKSQLYVCLGYMDNKGDHK